jgi:predicted nucleic acid-binding protein
MILVDTNVVSEPMKPAPAANVRTWLNEQTPGQLYLASTSLAELLLGIEFLPSGKRRQGMRQDLVEVIGTLFGPRVLPFDQAAAEAYATLVARARAAGRAVAMADGQIAAIAASRGFAVATRDEAPFAAAGVKTINPWTTGP